MTGPVSLNTRARRLTAVAVLTVFCFKANAFAAAASKPGPTSQPANDAAIEAGDLTLVRGDLRVAADAIRLARRTLAVIKGNLFWAFGYNVAALPLAAAGMLNPMIAGAAMAFSSVFVVTNSLRLRTFTESS